MPNQTVLTGIVVEENTVLTLSELCHACGKTTEWIMELVEEGVVQTEMDDKNQLQFHGQYLRRVRIVQRLQADLGINLAGAALALELLEEVEALRNRIAVLE